VAISTDDQVTTLALRLQRRVHWSTRQVPGRPLPHARSPSCRRLQNRARFVLVAYSTSVTKYTELGVVHLARAVACAKYSCSCAESPLVGEKRAECVSPFFWYTASAIVRLLQCLPATHTHSGKQQSGQVILRTRLSFLFQSKAI